MKNNYIINFIKVLIWPLLFSIGQIIIMLVFSSLYKRKNKKIFLKKNTKENYNEFINTKEYKDGLNNYINNHLIFIMIITIIIFIPIFLYQYSKYNITVNSFNLLKGLYLIIPAVFLAICLNLIINNVFSKEKNIDDSQNLILAIVSSGIIGPILEEYLFRGIVFNELLTFNSIIVSYFLTTIIFALFHQNFSQILYSTIFGFVLNFIYIKTNNLIYPIIFHISANTVVTIFINKIILLNKKVAFLMSIIFSLIFIISYIFLYNILTI